MAKRRYWIEIFKGVDGKFYFHRKAANGKINSPSQGYATKSNAKRAAKKLFPGIVVED